MVMGSAAVDEFRRSCNAGVDALAVDINPGPDVSSRGDVTVALKPGQDTCGSRCCLLVTEVDDGTEAKTVF